MIKLKDVIGSKEASKELIIGKDTVYIHTNIRPYEDKNAVTSMENDDKEKKSDLYIYDEVQMSKDEYLEMKQKELELMSKSQSSTEDLLQEIILKVYSE
ncbi:hypothetical protein [Anaerococcus lactolyticus]|uniref:hypothetical protein n=1 Tax=Anaerococcus lactolyticus TaxID=33032 RepID=UPI002889667F|nr:hypothetical protein [Anaerococcus lactolyticus]